MLIRSVAEKVGTIKAWGGAAAPAGWLDCNGAAVSRSTYAALFALLGTTYGVGDGATTFNVPDFRGRAVLGAGTGSGLTARARGASGGAETHVLAETEMPSHVHDKGNLLTNITATAATQVTGNGSGINTGAKGGGGTHNNMQPWGCAMMIIKAVP